MLYTNFIIYTHLRSYKMYATKRKHIDVGQPEQNKTIVK